MCSFFSSSVLMINLEFALHILSSGRSPRRFYYDVMISLVEFLSLMLPVISLLMRYFYGVLIGIVS